MKLIKRQDAGVAVESMRKNNIDEGLTIARKVDSMRGQLQELERQRNEFISGTKEAIGREIALLNTQLDGLKIELKNGREELERLRLPLDKEWEQVRQRQLEVTNEREEIIKTKNELSVREVSISWKEEESLKQLRAADSVKQKSDEVLREAESNKRESVEILKDSKNKVAEKNREIEERIKAVKAKEDEVAFERAGVEQVRKNNATKESYLQERETQINDRYKTLQETMEYVNKEKAKLNQRGK